MKKKMYQNAAANHFREHSSIYLFIIVLFLMGVIFGAIVVNSLSFNQKKIYFIICHSFLTRFPMARWPTPMIYLSKAFFITANLSG